MALFTRLTLDDASALLGRFGVGPATGLAPIAGGAINSNFRVDTAAGPLFLRVNEGKADAEVELEFGVVRHLAARGLPTPRVHATVDGGAFARHGAAQVSLFDWAEGRGLGPSEVRAGHARQVGAALARLHLAGRELADLRAGRYTFDAVRERLRGVAGCGDAEVAAAEPELWAEAGWLPAHRRADLPRGLIHQDLFRDNVLFAGDDLAAVLDFEQACDGPWGYDLAVAVLDWCWDGGFDFARARALVGGYRALRELEEVEWHGLWAEARAAAWRFTVTRITEVHLPSGGAPRLDKDFRRYLARLRALRALGDDAFRAALGR